MNQLLLRIQKWNYSTQHISILNILLIQKWEVLYWVFVDDYDLAGFHDEQEDADDEAVDVVSVR